MIPRMLIQQTPGMESSLPAAPADPLHILPTVTLVTWLVAAGLLLLVLALFVLERFLQRRRSPAEGPSPTPEAALAVSPPIGISARIKALERKFLETKAFREGCHALASAAKTHLGQRTGLGVERMTSLEIELAVEDDRVGRFMRSLSRRRYGRDEPRRKHFVAACAEARELLV